MPPEPGLVVYQNGRRYLVTETRMPELGEGWCDVCLINTHTRQYFKWHHFMQPHTVVSPTAEEQALFAQFRLAPETLGAC